MENPENVENLKTGPDDTKPEQRPEMKWNDSFGMENAAEKYVEELREKFRKMKEREKDPHLNLINPDDLTYGDLVIFDKWLNGTLTRGDFENYSREIRARFEDIRHFNRAKSEIEAIKREYSSGSISGEEFDEKFRKILAAHNFDEGRPGAPGAISEMDSRANLEAMIRNRMVASRKI